MLRPERKIFSILGLLLLAFVTTSVVVVSSMSASIETIAKWSSSRLLTDDYWAVAYGGSGVDIGRSIIGTSDGGYLFAGNTTSFKASATDIWLVKLDQSGQIEWQKRMGETGTDKALSVIETNTNEIVVVAETTSFGTPSNDDIWVVKLDNEGNRIWQYIYGGSGSELPGAIIQTSDGGLAIVGSITTYGAGNYDFWLLKLDSDGNIEFQETYGGIENERAYSIIEVSNSDLVLGGSTSSYGAGNRDGWLIKIDSKGNLIWQKAIGGSDIDEIRSIVEVETGIIATGYSESYTGNEQAWISKFSHDGEEVWARTFDYGYEHQKAYSADSASNGSDIIAIILTIDSQQFSDYLVVKISSNGEIIWTKAIGGISHDRALDVHVTTSDDIAIAGFTKSFGSGGDDAWVVLLNSTAEISGCEYSKTATTNSSVITNAITTTDTITKSSYFQSGNDPVTGIGSTNSIGLYQCPFVPTPTPVRTPKDFIPIVIKDPTPTPTPTPTPVPSPTPTPTRAPRLRDGDYSAKFSNGGEIWFTVINNGNNAINGGFILRNTIAPWCSWYSHLFPDIVQITNGEFRFWDIEGQSLRARLECQSRSSVSAGCQAVDYAPGSDGYCNRISGLARLE